MPTTLLAVDDSATMRKSLEITFSGEDFRVVTAGSTASALAKLSENPSVVLIDTLLGADDGYALGKEIRAKAPDATIIFLASKGAPYDAAKGKDAGADDFADKPFDTQQLLDKTRKAIAAHVSGGAPQAPAVRAPAPSVSAAPAAPPAAPTPPSPAAAPSAPRAPAPPPLGAAPRAATLVFGAAATPAIPATRPGANPSTVKTAAAPPAPVDPRPATPLAAAPVAPHGAAPATAAAPAAASPVAAAAVASMAPKLSELGLSKEQAEAILTLSREVIERVVWEVVPQLAETLIKEEIARILKE